MKLTQRKVLRTAAISAAFIAGTAMAADYGTSSYGTGYGPSTGYGTEAGYGPGSGYGMPYGGPRMGFPQRPMPPKRPEPPKRPMPPERPMMGGPYGYGGGMGRPYMPGIYGKPGGHRMPGAYGMQQPYRAPGGYGTPMPAAPAEPAPAAEATASAAVSISQMRFDAPTVTIEAGGTVTWTNRDAVPHTVTADDGSFGSAQLGAGGTFSHTFDKPGTYSYHCELHPTMRATVVVVG